MKTTSLLAYENKKPTIKNDHEKILDVMSKTQDYTYNEIAKLLNWFNPNKVSRRLAELVRRDKIRVLQERKCNVAKSTCQSYVLV